eukprot:m.147467 g.147467  ORF g.147467 m.147467 type:complete len:69 (-) comp13242_c0_seq4:223-429(-)
MTRRSSLKDFAPAFVKAATDEGVNAHPSDASNCDDDEDDEEQDKRRWLNEEEKEQQEHKDDRRDCVFA